MASNSDAIDLDSKMIESGRNFSESSSTTAMEATNMDEKPETESQDLEENEVTTVPASSTTLASLQVVGAFVLMFNSW